MDFKDEKINFFKDFDIDKIISSNSDKSAFFLPVIEHMNKNYNRYISISELARLVYVDPAYFIRKFKNTYGVPPITFFNNIRIKKAIELLILTDDSVRTVSKKMGMEETSYFSRWFKKNSGFSPSEFRKIYKYKK